MNATVTHFVRFIVPVFRRSAVARDTDTRESGIFPSRSSPFPVEATTPLWKKVAVPGALVVGAIGALGTYHATSRLAGGPSQSGDAGQAAGIAYSSSAGVGSYPGAGHAEQRGTNVSGEDASDGGDYAQDGFPPSQHREGGTAYPMYDRGGGDVNFPRTGEETLGAGDSSTLAGEFRRLTETMEQQTGHLVQAVDAMKALASRAEQDSSSLLAARVSSHTSELRAELGTIKQLLLLQAGGGGGGGAPGADRGAASAGGVRGAGSVGADGTDNPSDRGKDKGTESSEAPLTANGHVKVEGGVEGAADKGEAAGARGLRKDDEQEREKAKEGTACTRSTG